MTITTKYKVEEFVCYLNDGKAVWGRIKQIFFEGVEYPNDVIKCDFTYRIQPNIVKDGEQHIDKEESELFLSKADLINSL